MASILDSVSNGSGASNAAVDSITSILRNHAQPTMGDTAQAATANLVGQINPNDLKEPGSVTPQSMANSNVEAEIKPQLGIVDVLNKASQSGSTEAKTVMDAFQQFAPDPGDLAKLVQAAHEDPQQITPTNAATWAARKSQDLGLGTLSRQAKEADIGSKNAEATYRRAMAGEGIPAVDGDGTVLGLLGSGGTGPSAGKERTALIYRGVKAPSGYEWFQGADGKVTQRAIAGGPNDIAVDPKAQAAKTKVNASARAFHDKTLNVVKTIDSILPQVDNWTAGVGSKLSMIPGTAARDLEANLASIKANLGFNELAEMRANSPTGGALGNVSDRETALLQSVVANLEQSQSPAQLVANLKSARNTIISSWNRVKQQYDDQYGAGQGSAPAPAAGAPKAPAAAAQPDASAGWSDADERRMRELEAKMGGR